MLRIGVLLVITLPVVACAQDSPPICNSLPGTLEEISATPRADVNLELMALRRSDGITADQAVYDRLTRDVAAVKALAPDVSRISYTRPYEPGVLLISLDAKSLQLVKAGKYHAWKCANRHYRLVAVEPAENYVKLQLKGNYDMEKLADIYKEFPGVYDAEPNRTTSSDNFFTLCATLSADTWNYVLAENMAGVPKLHFFSVDAAGAVNHLGVWMASTTDARPDWVDRNWNKNSCR